MKKIILILIIFYSIDNFSQSVEKKEDNNIYSMTGINLKPEYPEGLAKLNLLIKESYIKEGIQSKDKRKKYATFVIEKDGSLTDIKILNSTDSNETNFFIQKLESLPKWIPGKHKGMLVRVHYALPLVVK